MATDLRAAGIRTVQSAHAVGDSLDLPLKALAWQDPQGRCWLGYNAPEYLQRRHGFAPALMANLAALDTLIEAAARAD